MGVKSINVSNKNDFISREAAIQKRHGCNMDCSTCDFAADGDSWCNGELFVVDLMCVPAVDVKPIVKAEWLSRMDGTGICSNCHRLDHIDPLATHCRFCGAEMIKDKRDCENN